MQETDGHGLDALLREAPARVLDACVLQRLQGLARAEQALGDFPRQVTGNQGPVPAKK